MQRHIGLTALALALFCSNSDVASAAGNETIEARLDRLERENSELKKMVSKLSKEVSSDSVKRATTEKKTVSSTDPAKTTSAAVASTSNQSPPTEKYPYAVGRLALIF